MKFLRCQFKNEHYQLWQMGLLLPTPLNASVYSVKYRKNENDEYSRVTLKAVSVNDALERACYAITYTSPWMPEDIDLHAVYDVDENLLWVDEPFYDLIQKKNEFRGMERREFLKRFGATSAAILYGLQPSVAHAIIPFGFIKKINVRGEQLYTSGGSFTWSVPSGVNKVCIFGVGGGAGGYDATVVIPNSHAGPGGGGGGSFMVNDLAVSPGQSFSVGVSGPASGGQGYGGANWGGNTSFVYGSTTYAGGGGGPSGLSGGAPGTGGGKGGDGVEFNARSGGSGGAGGMSGGGGNGGSNGVGISSGGGGGGGGRGGGASLYGGIGGAGEGGGSGGPAANADASGVAFKGSPGGYGAGGASTASIKSNEDGAGGAIRIIWGSLRKFPDNAI